MKRKSSDAEENEFTVYSNQYIKSTGSEEELRTPSKRNRVEKEKQNGTDDEKLQITYSTEHQAFNSPNVTRTLFLPSTPSTTISDVSNSTTQDSVGNMRKCNQIRSLSHQENLEIYRQILQQPEVKDVFQSVKSGLQNVLKQKVMKLASEREEITVKYGLETAASIDLLKVFDAYNNDELDVIAEGTRTGALLLQEGLKKVEDGKKLMEKAFTQISKKMNGALSYLLE